MENREINLTKKNIRDFSPNETLYIQKLENKYSVDYLVRFDSFARGIVKGTVMSSDGYSAYFEKGTTITARLSSCYLWGADDEDTWRNCCHWFKKDGFVDTLRHK